MAHAIRVKYSDENGYDTDLYHVRAETTVEAYRKVSQDIKSDYEETPTPSDADIDSMHHDGHVDIEATLVT